jgi:hypothetical protein
VITPADKPNAALFPLAIAQMRFRIEATPMHAELEPGVSWSRLSEQNFRVDKWSLCRG